MLWRYSWPCLCATVATSIFDASSALCQLCNGFSTGRFLSDLSLPPFCTLHVWSVLVSAFRCHAGCHIHPGGFNHWGLHHCNPWSLPVAGICVAWWWLSAHTRYAQSGCSPTTLNRGTLCYSVCCSLAIPSIWGIQLWGLAESHLNPTSSLHGWDESSFPGLVPSDDTVDSESAMRIKLVDSGMVNGYQVDEFTHTWSVEWFVAHSNIYPGFTGKVSSLTHFPWNWVVRIILIWTRPWLTLNKARIPSSPIPLRHQNWMLPWVSLIPFHLQSLLGFFIWLVLLLIILSCNLLLA